MTGLLLRRFAHSRAVGQRNVASKTLLIVYHSVTGASQQMAHAVADGALRHEAERGASGLPAPRVNVRVDKAVDLGVSDVLAADGYVFACPENLAAISGLMKDFFDRTYYGERPLSGATSELVRDLRRAHAPVSSALLLCAPLFLGV
jgi:multimeric flavodoxin WrbA